MKELHVLLDYENVLPSLEALAKLAPGFTDVWLFHGPHQVKQAQAYAAGHERVTTGAPLREGQECSGFSFVFLPRLCGGQALADAELVVVANDKGLPTP
ncbi:MAG: hypothetical protein U5M53_03525 [Rhodoferax sp.]|nr:hypothetical protein [Rhodoferax sp.]